MTPTEQQELSRSFNAATKEREKPAPADPSADFKRRSDERRAENKRRANPNDPLTAVEKALASMRGTLEDLRRARDTVPMNSPAWYFLHNRISEVVTQAEELRLMVANMGGAK